MFDQTDEGFGFNVMGGSEQKCPIYISRVIPDGYADRYLQINCLYINDYVLFTQRRLCVRTYIMFVLFIQTRHSETR